MITKTLILAGLRKGLGFIFDDGRGMLLAGLALAASFVGWFAFENQKFGASSANAKGRIINDKAHSIGSAAARNSNRAGVPGSMLDPTTRWE